MTILTTNRHLPQATPAENRARTTFQILMWALSNPGRIFSLAAHTGSTLQSCQQIGKTLLDLETSFYTPDRSLRNSLHESGARFLTAANAAYLFFPDAEAFAVPMLQPTLDCIALASVGNFMDPEQGATLIVAAHFGQGLQLRLRGPGIDGEANLRVDTLPVKFWQLRQQKINYPLGIDLFLVDGSRVVGLPRTIQMELS